MNTKKLFVPALILGSLSLAACVAVEPVSPSPQTSVVTTPVVVAQPQYVAPGQVIVQQQPAVVGQVVTTTPALRAGYGRVDTITPLVDAPSNQHSPLRRLGLRMDDGYAQYVDTRAANIRVGERVQITNDGNMLYPMAASSNSRY
jgi:hypothetical protein